MVHRKMPAFSPDAILNHFRQCYIAVCHRFETIRQNYRIQNRIALIGTDQNQLMINTGQRPGWYVG